MQPSQVIIHNTPQDSRSDMNADQGIYAQDAWTVGRFTINPGVRFEHFNSSIEGRARRRAASCRSGPSPARANVPNWNDVSPRFGVAWDVQGNGKTAVKVGIGKYVRAYSSGFVGNLRPELLHAATLTWTDLNGDDIAQGGIVRAGTRLPARAGCEIDFSTLPATFGVEAAAELRRRHQAALPDRDERQRAARNRARRVGHLHLHPPRLQEPHLVRQPRIDPSDYTQYTVAEPAGTARP